MDRGEALKLLNGGDDGVLEWNRRRDSGVGVPDLRGVVINELVAKVSAKISNRLVRDLRAAR